MTDGPVDLRSDTVTRPTPAMRRAMADAEVGDDVYGEDPTVNALQEAFAERVGKEAALYVPTGTMGNQLAVMVQTRPGDSVIVGARQHLLVYETNAAARNAGVQLHQVPDERGAIRADDIRHLADAGSHHYPTVSLVAVENTHMPANGAPWDLAALREVAACGVPVHMDGARLFNAEVATGTSAADYAAQATTVMACMSKGLCAPVGSLLAGPAALIAEARRERQHLGGNMRQAGVIAAAALVALTDMVERLADDHRRAAALAEAVAERWPDGGLDPAAVCTNMVIWRHPDARALVAHLAAEGVVVGTIEPGVVRAVTHHDIDDDGLERARKAIATAP
ncbi:MAG TPA: GntG family PLP-dependent aldolase [Acidimicrobiales bacterium]|nr:GntG family PLP-dependent aldolase [Acidimicrobiales bacterium]